MTRKAKPIGSGNTNKVLSKIEELRRKDEKHTLSLRLDGELNQVVISLMDRTGAKTAQQAIRESIVLYDLILSEAEKGKDITVSDPSSEEQYPLFA